MEIASPKKILNALRNVRFGYLKTLLRFSFQKYPGLYLCVLLMLLSVVLEALAMTAFIPLSEIASGRPLSSGNIVVEILSVLQLKATSPKYIFLGFIVIFGLRIVTQIVGERLLMLITENKMPANLVSQGLRNVLHYVPISEIERKSIGYYITLTSEEVARACTLIGTLIRFISSAVLIMLYYATIAKYSPSTAIGIVIFLFLSGLISFGILRKVHRLGGELMESAREGSSLFVDALNGVRSIRAFTAEQYVSNRFEGYVLGHKRRVFLIGFFSLLGKLFPMLLLIVSFGLYILIVTQINHAPFDYAFAVTLLIFLMRFFMAIGEAVNVFVKIVSDTKVGQDITEIIHIKETAEAGHKYLQFQTLQGSINNITLQGLCFSYTSDNVVLHDLSLSLQCGKSYAIVGESGSGKSTLLDILLRFHDPQTGYASINEVPLTSLEEHEVRKRIILLGQETIIFNDTISNNISYGREILRENLVEASRLACVDEVIGHLPDGYATVLQYRGTNLSGGQRQRIGLARALARKPEVLILDESMSALDPMTKEKVTDNIIAEYRDKIVIFVSHDPAIREKVDVVIELRKYAGLLAGESQALVYEAHLENLLLS